MRHRACLPLALAGLAIAAAPAAAAPSPTQSFFTQRLLADKGTSREVKDLLRTRQAFVDRTLTFKDLTGDKRADILGFGSAGVWESLNNGSGSFAPATMALSQFGYTTGGWRVEKHPRHAVGRR